MEDIRANTRTLLRPYCHSEEQCMMIEENAYTSVKRTASKRNLDEKDEYYRKIEATISILLAARKLEF